jgi:hypothetical protein
MAPDGDEMTGQRGCVGKARLSETEFRALYQRLRQQARWGAADGGGALNYITPAEVLAAVGEVRLGRTATLAAPVETGVTPSGRYTSRSAVNRPLLTAWRSAW